MDFWGAGASFLDLLWPLNHFLDLLWLPSHFLVFFQWLQVLQVLMESVPGCLFQALTRVP